MPNPPNQVLNADPTEVELLKQMHDHAHAQMEAAQADPTQQQYFMRMDKKTIVLSEGEYHFCIGNGIPLTMVDYNTAVQSNAQQDAKLRAKRRTRKANKRARASRKANRKHG